VELGLEPAPHSVFFSAAASERARVGGLSLVRFGAIRLSVRQCWFSWLGLAAKLISRPLKSSDCNRGARQAASQFGRASRDPCLAPVNHGLHARSEGPASAARAGIQMAWSFHILASPRHSLNHTRRALVWP
jgi:hypothetical protein